MSACRQPRGTGDGDFSRTISYQGAAPDLLSGTPRAHSIDRWIFVAMAAWFIVIVLIGFIPDAVMKVEMVRAGLRPPFPPIMHVHAVLMGSFLLLLLAQTWLMATGRKTLHMQLGVLGMVLAAALVVVGCMLAPTMYYQTWNALQAAPAAARGQLHQLLSLQENILLLQMHAGILFGVLMTIALWARGTNSGFHKRMVILATAIPLGASIDRMWWLPNTFPGSPMGTDGYILLAVAPLLLWDVMRNRRLHEAYLVWVAIWLPTSLLMYRLWDTPGWHSLARHIMRV
jgi:hypothetical protein